VFAAFLVWLMRLWVGKPAPAPEKPIESSPS
jgi:hypothetical protein